MCNTLNIEMDRKKRQEPIIADPISQSSRNENMNAIFTKNLFIFLIVAVVLGAMTGYVLSPNRRSVSGDNMLNSGSVDSSKITKGTVVGSNDTKTFKDTATGTLKNGGINGEGQFHLIRPGGDSQSVYLTSSSVDLSKFVGKKIKIWGETQAAQYAGWLMDVGRIEVLE